MSIRTEIEFTKRMVSFDLKLVEKYLNVVEIYLRIVEPDNEITTVLLELISN